MKIVIPMMGLGERFYKSGYTEYKPLVRINSEHLIKSIVSKLIKYFSEVYIVCNKEISEQIRCLFDKEVKLIVLNSKTRGASETILKACDFLPENEHIACMDCDTILYDSAILKLLNVKSNAILSFKDVDKTGIYSYLSIDPSNKILDIKEKIAISEVANAGIYVFRNSEVLKNHCEKIVNSEGELYLSKAVKSAIDSGEYFESIDISNFFECCGTPYQLKKYSKDNIKSTKKTICFDIDGTLIYDLYKNPKAIEKNVKFCNECYKLGHKIILHTARGMLSNKGDAKKIQALKPYIEKTLKDLGILYDELILMKPYADLYIDDKAIAAHKDLEKETGLYVYQEHEPRSHHKIVVDGNTIIKQGCAISETNYYQTIPENIKTFFPKIYSIGESSIEMEKLCQSTYSSLLLSKKLTKSDIDTLIDTLKILHYSNVESSTINFSWAYKDKLYDRLKKYKSVYELICLNLDKYKSNIDSIQTYNLGLIHGDTVFTNVFLNGSSCKFIDPRGKWENEDTFLGDTDYDYAKILQSLYGYDYVLHSEPIDHAYLKSLRDHFLQKISESEMNIDIQQLKNKTISLYISLIPFHKEDLEKCKNYIKIIENII